jgi:hypothetical protein
MVLNLCVVIDPQKQASFVKIIFFLNGKPEHAESIVSFWSGGNA